MKKYKNLGKNVAFVIDGKTYSFQNGQVTLIPDNMDIKYRVEDALIKIIEVSEEKESVQPKGAPITVLAEIPLGETLKPVVKKIKIIKEKKKK